VERRERGGGLTLVVDRGAAGRVGGVTGTGGGGGRAAGHCQTRDNAPLEVMRDMSCVRAILCNYN
jgi:hypothetical protein